MKQNLIDKLRAYLAGYCHFADPQITLPLALWIVGTYIFEAFDTYPYLIVTARVKRAGKTRLSELIGFASNMPFNVSGATAPALFRKIKDDKPTILWDEAEQLNSEANTLVRAFLNVGYRKGQTIPRVGEGGVTEWPTYCPKVFILIGDVYDTLRERSIICEMERGTPERRFSYETAKQDGLDLADEIRERVAPLLPNILDAYGRIDLKFLTDRDEEIWRPLFAIGSVLDSAAVAAELLRIAADLSAEKTNPYRYTENRDAEIVAASEEYGRMALRDMAAICKTIKPHNRKGGRGISSADAVEALKKIPTSPWRKFYAPGSPREIQGNGQYNAACGLTMNQLSDFLRPYGIVAKLIRQGSNVFRGYDAAAIESAAQKAKVTQ